MNAPVNLTLLKLEEKDLVKLGEVSELNIFSSGNTFHPHGLFSSVLFGQVGNPIRNKTFAYTDLHCEVLHPVVYRAIIGCKAYYKQIMEGSVSAVWNLETKEFERSTESHAETGYTFFLKHLPELQFKKNDSERRSANIELINNALKENKALLRYLLVMPAGLRDYSVNPNGVPEEDEINTYYRRIMPQSQLIDPLMAKKNPHVYDNIYSNLQNSLNELFWYIESLMQGKNKLVLGKWLSRKIFNSTRNVLTASVNKAVSIDDQNRIRSNEVGCGLYQFLRAIAPISLFSIKNTYLSDVFVENNQFAYLTNMKTLQKEEVLGSHIQKDYDQWTSMEGLETLIDNFGNLDIRHFPVTLNKGKHYLGLIYNDGKYVKFFQGINDVPESMDKKHVSPVTMGEILYMSVARHNCKFPGLTTRYPINGYGGIYPAWIKIRTTTEYQQLEELNDLWEPSGHVFPTFPIRDKDYLNGIAVHQSHMALMGADMDGDTISLVAMTTDEAIEEIRKTLNSKSYYLNSEKKIIFGNSADVLSAVLAYMTD
ncbi:hypothetical protein [Flavobacterium sp.]|jgi:hypothetical protein|uniref:hypothetical protein n=1 Tax=Flavobacterium sp. TaxID=239 RepID=UPI0037BF622C